MKNTKKIVILLTSVIFTLSLVGCSRSETGNKDSDGALKAFNAIVKSNPKNKGFHNALEHWGFKLGTDDKFEWTKDTSANKIDFAMIMAADPLIKAGLDVKKLEGTGFKLEVAGKDNMDSKDDQLVKSYKLK